MTTFAHSGTVVSHPALFKTGKHTMLVSLATIAVIVGVACALAYSQADRAMTILQLFLPDNRFSAVPGQLDFVSEVRQD